MTGKSVYRPCVYCTHALALTGMLLAISPARRSNMTTTTMAMTAMTTAAVMAMTMATTMVTLMDLGVWYVFFCFFFYLADKYRGFR
jgi:hypothetical protein